MNKDTHGEHLRVTPGQARAKATFEAILATSERLLVDHGLPGFNTNTVAKASGYNIATVYHYFPDKNAILRELTARQERERQEVAGPQWAKVAEADDLAAWVSETVDLVAGLSRNSPAGLAVRRACRTMPELADQEAASDDATADRLLAALRRRWPRMPQGRDYVASRMIIHITTGVLNGAVEAPEVAPIILGELKTLLLGYLQGLAPT